MESLHLAVAGTNTLDGSMLERAMVVLSDGSVGLQSQSEGSKIKPNKKRIFRAQERLPDFQGAFLSSEKG